MGPHPWVGGREKRWLGILTELLYLFKNDYYIFWILEGPYLAMPLG